MFFRRLGRTVASPSGSVALCRAWVEPLGYCAVVLFRQQAAGLELSVGRFRSLDPDAEPAGPDDVAGALLVGRGLLDVSAELNKKIWGERRVGGEHEGPR